MNIKNFIIKFRKDIIKKEIKIFSSVILDQGIVSFGNFLTTFILLKFLGLRDFGLFSAIWILIISTNTLQESLIVSPLLSIGAKLKFEHQRDYISNLKFLQLIFSFLISFIIILIIFFGEDSLKLENIDAFLLLSIFISISLIQYCEFCRRVIYLTSTIKHLTFLDLNKYLIQIILLIISLRLGFKSEFNILFVYSISSFFTILLSSKYIPNLKVNIKSLIKTYKQNWVISKWLLSTSVIQLIQSNYLFFLSNVILGPISLGVLKVFQSILGISHIFLHSIHSWLPVKTSKEFINNRSNFKNNIIRIILIF